MITPSIDYIGKDYLGVRTQLLEFLTRYYPDYTERTEADLGIMLVNLFSYSADIMTYYLDRVAQEMNIVTATDNFMIASLCKWLGYDMGCMESASTTLTFSVSAATTIPSGTRVASVGTREDPPVYFNTTEEVVATAAGDVEVEAVEGILVAGELVGTSDMSIFQEFPLDHIDVIQDSVRLFVNDGGGDVEWTYVDDFINSLPSDKHFVVFRDFRGNVYIGFGDDITGKVPTYGASITVYYRIGRGASGNVEAGTLITLIDSVSYVTAVTNVSKATGGRNAESLTEAKVNAPASLKALGRAVTLSDYEVLARQYAGVCLARAYYVATTVFVSIVPSGGGDPSDTLLEDVAELFDSNKEMVSHNVVVVKPKYLTVNISVVIHVKSGYNSDQVKTDVESMLDSFMEYDAVDDDETYLHEFNRALRLSDIYSIIESVRGVDYSTIEEPYGDVLCSSDTVIQKGDIAVTVG